MRLLLGSGGLRSEERRAIYFEEMARHFDGCDEVIFVPYASSDHHNSSFRMSEFSARSGVKIRGIETFDDPVDAIANAAGIYVGGGNTFLERRG